MTLQGIYLSGFGLCIIIKVHKVLKKVLYALLYITLHHIYTYVPLVIRHIYIYIIMYKLLKIK